VAKKLKKT
jgi:HD superfamily phosphohydrolase